MKRQYPPTPRVSIFVEALEPRIAPAALINTAKLTAITFGTPQLLDASGGPNSFQGLTTGAGGTGQILLYITSGKALVFTSDIAGNGKYEPGDITGIAVGLDGSGHPLNMTLFTDVNGDIVTDLLPGAGVSQLSASNNTPDGRVLLDENIGSITLRTLTSADLDPTIPGNTVANRLALTHFSIYGNILCGGSFGGLTIDTSGESLLATKFNGATGDELFTTADPTIGGIYTGTAAGGQSFHFTQLSGNAAVEGTLLAFNPPAGEHGGDISDVAAASNTTIFNIGTIETGNGGFGARGGDISDITLHTNGGAYDLIAGDGGEGVVGAPGGSIVAFSDLGSTTGQVMLHTGSGGFGELGIGGAGGTATFGTVNIAADVDVILGHGGNGFTAGGNGAGLPAAVFTVPEGGIPLGDQFSGTYHAIGDIGDTFQLANGTYSPQVIDFTGNGFGDGIFTTTNPDQLVIVFGNGVNSLVDNTGNPNSALASETIRLTAPGPITSFTVGDFTGNGKLDIAVASAAAGNSGGIEVFLNQIGNATLNPLGAANFSTNPLGAHPFSAGLFSAVPTLTDFGFYATTGGILALTAGDFNGDGIMDIGYVQQVTLIDPPTNPVYEAVGELFGSAARNPATGQVLINPTTGHAEGTGYFFANPAPEAAAPLLQVSFYNTTEAPILRATSLTSANVPIGSTNGIPTNPEVLLVGFQGSNVISNDIYVVTQGTVSGAGSNLAAVALGQVDTNRLTGATNISPTQATLQSFSVQDLDGDGNADLVALTNAPNGFIVDFTGNGTGVFALASGTGDNAGIFLGNGTINAPPTTALAAIDAGSTGSFSDVAVLQFPPGGPAITEYGLTMGGMVLTNAQATNFNSVALGDNLDVNQAIQGFDAFYEQAATAADPHPLTGFGLLSPNSTVAGDSFLNIFVGTKPFNYALTESIYLTNNGYKIYSGSGGNAASGPGGDGGVLGTGALSVNTIGNAAGSISITFPAYTEYEGNSLLSGGHGGNGFTTGGSGGDISGVSAAYISGSTEETSSIQLTAGNGGNGISGAGGRGGILSEFSTASGIFFSAGNGGTGLAGGTGGSVTGNTVGIFDTSTADVTILSGSGGVGQTSGGAAGNITNIDSVFLPIIGGTGGSLSFITGHGGSAAGGAGGNGGSIVNSSPDTSVNNLAGPVVLDSGAGGSGLTGGSGGAISNFVNSPTNTSIASSLNVIAGVGGIGVSGAGGPGGTITNVQSDATGLTSSSFSTLNGVVTVLAGNGGDSYATTGGAGGSIVNSTVTATSTALAVAAGAGGDAPLVGGQGGSVTNSILSSAAQQFGKMLVIAGDGGNATAVTEASVVVPGDANTNDLAHALLAFGGANGIGGNGGNISNITQPTGAETAVDLIAGNGGSTINSGGPLAANSAVGIGGSVVGVNLAGTVGSLSRDLVPVSYPPIKSYTDVNDVGVDSETTAAFVQNDLSGTVSLAQTNISHGFIPNDPSFMLSDAVGNVGIVAGRAGLVKGGLGASNGIDGSVENIAASSIMSIVAGSVNNVAPAQVISGITVTNPDGVLGADKSLPTSITAGGPNSQLDYFNPQGMDVQNLQAGDRLIDGALFAITIPPNITGPRVFAINNTGT